MRYETYRDLIEKRLEQAPDGLTWSELKSDLDLPQNRPCPAWTERLEKEVGLDRTARRQRKQVWRILNKQD